MKRKVLVITAAAAAVLAAVRHFRPHVLPAGVSKRIDDFLDSPGTGSRKERP